MQPLRGWIVIGAVVVTGGSLLLGRFNALANLQVQAEARRQAVERLGEIRQENARLQGKARSDEGVTDAALAAARAEVAALRGQMAAESMPTAKPEEVRLDRGAKLDAADWRNAGTAAPAATLETVLWAAAGGDVEVLAKTLTFANGGAEKAANAWFDSLPLETRQRYGSVDRLIATLAVPDIPSGSVVVNNWSDAAEDQPTRFVSVQLASPDGATKPATLMFVRRGAEWRLGVTRAVVTKYASRLPGDGAVAR